VKFDTLFFQVFNDKNELIRSIKRKAPKENGVHRMYWHFEENGHRGPSRRKVKKNSNLPSGVTVLPGNYTIKLHFGNQTATQKITVDYDPRVNMPLAVLQSKYDLLKQLDAKLGVAGKATQQLLVSKEIVKDYQKRIKAQHNKEKFKELLKSHTKILKEIDGLLDDMLGKEDKRQGITATEFPSNISYLYKASGYVNSLLQKPGPTEITLVKNANKKVGDVVSKINKFYETDWIDYQKSVENLKLSPFKKQEELKY
jgi:hypothetical protein